MAIAAAAEQKVDATPMEGFLEDSLDKILNLKGTYYKSSAILPLGYRDHENDWLADMKKYRAPTERFITVMTKEDADFSVGTMQESLKDIFTPE